MNKDLSNIRQDYNMETLHESGLSNNPVQEFKLWLHEAIEVGQPEPTAMTLCTISAVGEPSARIVLLKNIEEETGFWFYTNYNSQKGKDLALNPQAALNFFWPSLQRQVRIKGAVKKISATDSDAYFNSRPLQSQIGAIASPQSQVIESREQLESWFAKAEKSPVSRPSNWGGYALLPSEIEFWQGRASRLHDRIRYRLENAKWIRERLAP